MRIVADNKDQSFRRVDCCAMDSLFVGVELAPYNFIPREA
jgi:hypothetical protein